MSQPAEKHWFGAYNSSSKGEGHPVLFGKPKPARHFGPFPDGGGYPKGFIEWAMREMGCKDASTILHLCSGSMVTGVRVDIRPEMKPDIVADCRNVPLPDESFDFIMADPPYSKEYAANLYGTGAHYPLPSQILREAARLLRVGGKVGLLHHIVPMNRKPLKLRGVYGLTTGLGSAIRAFTVLEKVDVDSTKFRYGK